MLFFCNTLLYTVLHIHIIMYYIHIFFCTIYAIKVRLFDSAVIIKKDHLALMPMNVC